jgi:hypothetical protein
MVGTILTPLFRMEKNMNIAKCNLDKRGRLTLPLSFLKANDINPIDYTAVVQVVQNNSMAVKVAFIKKDNKRSNNDITK